MFTHNHYQGAVLSTANPFKRFLLLKIKISSGGIYRELNSKKPGTSKLDLFSLE